MSRVIVDTEWLASRLGSPGLRIVEAPHETATYDGGHIPGAVCVDWRRDLMASGDESDGHVITPRRFAGNGLITRTSARERQAARFPRPAGPLSRWR